MIGKLSGYIDSINEESIILNVQDVGYEVFIPLSLKSSLSNQSKISLFIVTYVREDNIILFGFLSEYDKKLFNLLNTVQGIGPKLALSIMNIESATIVTSIDLQNPKIFKSISGIGNKVASRILNELKDKVSKLSKDVHIYNSNQNCKVRADIMDISMEVINALKVLGYSDKEADQAVKYSLDNIGSKEEIPSVEDLVKQALKFFSKSN